MRGFALRSILRCALSCVLMVCATITDRSEAGALLPRASFAYFGGKSEAQLANTVFKLTYVGRMTQELPSVVLHVSSDTVNTDKFLPFQEMQYPYRSDERYKLAAQVTAHEMSVILDSIGTYSCATSGAVDTFGVLSVALWDSTSDSTTVYQTVKGGQCARWLTRAVLRCVGGNSAAKTALVSLGCMTSLLPSNQPPDVTSQVSVSLSGLRYNRLRNLYVGKVKVTNTSGQSIPTPLDVALQLDGRVAIYGGSGVTSCLVNPPGQAYVRMQATGTLGTSASIEKTVFFENPDRAIVRVTAYKAFGGPGDR